MIEGFRIDDVVRSLAANDGDDRPQRALGAAAPALVGPAEAVRRQHDVVERPQRIVGGNGFDGEDIEPRAGDLAARERFRQSRLIDDGAARRVDEIGIGAHQAEFAFADDAARGRRQRQVQADEIGLA